MSTGTPRFVQRRSTPTERSDAPTDARLSTNALARMTTSPCRARPDAPAARTPTRAAPSAASCIGPEGLPGSASGQPVSASRSTRASPPPTAGT